MHYVYEITNLINNKKYIGKRSCNCPIEKDTYMGSGKYLKRAIKKYGKENFAKKILEICETEEDAFLREKYHIEKVEAWNNPMYYNISSGGDGGFGNFAGKSEEELLEWKRKMSLSRKNRVFTEEWKRKIVQTRKERGVGVGKNNPMYGVKGKDNKKSKVVVMLSMDGKFLQSFDSLQLAKEYLNISRSDSGISRSCIYKNSTAYGYKWMFKDEYDKLSPEDIINFISEAKENYNKHTLAKSENKNKKVIQLDATTLEFIAEFDNHIHAANILNILSRSIKRCCEHGCNTAGGYSFIYQEEFNTISKQELKLLYAHKYTKPDKSVFEKRKRKVICLTTGQIFDGMIDAIELFNLCKGARIDAVCRGTRKTAGKHPITKEPLRWAYYDGQN